MILSKRCWIVVCLVVMTLASVMSSFEPIQVMCEVNGKMIPAIVDTGAEISVMSTSCAKRCELSDAIDPSHSGLAIGVGSSNIIGGIEGLGIRIGPVSFQSKISILQNSNHRCDFIIGLDILNRFNCDILFRERVIKMYVRGNEIRVPLFQKNGQLSSQHGKDLYGHMNSPTNGQPVSTESTADIHLDNTENYNTPLSGHPAYSYFTEEADEESFLVDALDGENQVHSPQEVAYVVNRHCYYEKSEQQQSTGPDSLPQNRNSRYTTAASSSIQDPNETRSSYSKRRFAKPFGQFQHQQKQQTSSNSARQRLDDSHTTPTGRLPPQTIRGGAVSTSMQNSVVDRGVRQPYEVDYEEDLLLYYDMEEESALHSGDSQRVAMNDYDRFHARFRDHSVSMEGV